jgi:hypothetical protein
MGIMFSVVGLILSGVAWAMFCCSGGDPYYDTDDDYIYCCQGSCFSHLQKKSTCRTPQTEQQKDQQLPI